MVRHLKQRGRISVLAVLGALLTALLVLSFWSTAWATPSQDVSRQTVTVTDPTKETSVIVGSGGATATTQDQTASVAVPAGAVTAYTWQADAPQLIVTKLAPTQIPAPAAAGFKLGANVIEVAVFKLAVPQPGYTFNTNITICFKIAAADWTYAGQNSQNVKVQYYDTTTGTWANLATTVNLVTMEACGQVSHVTVFAMAVRQPATPTPVPTATLAPGVTPSPVPTATPVVTVTPTKVPATATPRLPSAGDAAPSNNLLIAVLVAGFVLLAAGGYYLRRQGGR